MADAKITALSENTTPLGTDILPMVDDPGGTPATQKITIANLKKNSCMFKVYRNSAQNSGNAAFAKIAFDTEVYDIGSVFDSATNNRFVAPVTGYYHFDAHTRMASTTTVGIMAIFKNGSEFVDGDDLRVSMSLMSLSVSTDIYLAATDYIEIFVYGNTAIALSVGSEQFTYFSGYLIST